MDEWKKLIDTSAIKQISLYVSSNMSNKQLIIDNVRARSNPELDPNYLVGLVDKFGQSAKTDFPHKVKTEAHLRALAQQELAELKANPVLPDRGTYGGWKHGPKLKATGYFRTEKVDGKWSLIDPEGYLFFSNGIANVRMANSTSFTGIDFTDDRVRYIDPEDVTPEDSVGIRPVDQQALSTRYVSSDMRHRMFNWLPDYNDPLANHYSYRRSSHRGPLPHGETFSFYQANLERRYGETGPDSYVKKWEQVTTQRMKSWGMTSFGNWVDPAFYHKNNFPYFANGWIIGEFKTVTSGENHWAPPMPDPYDPEFARRAEITTQVVAQEVKNNPWCIGVFIDNEKFWGDTSSVTEHYRIPIESFKLNAQDSPAKAAFTQVLKQKYKTVEALNQAWQSDIPSWSSFAAGFVVTDINAALKADLSLILETYATQYFKVVHNALEQVMPNHLYMSARMAAWGINPEGVKAASKYVDVMSYNLYREGVHDAIMDFLPDLDRPGIIGEYHFGANSDSGRYHPGLIHSANQKDRSRMYQDYMHQVIDNPYLVGAHWFQYTDSPLTGRAHDGENYNVGFVTNADVPYPEMVAAAREINRALYPRRFGNLVARKQID